jgi:hypothetical protein
MLEQTHEQNICTYKTNIPQRGRENKYLKDNKYVKKNESQNVKLSKHVKKHSLRWNICTKNRRIKIKKRN